MSKLLLLGATGTIGSAVAELLADDHEVLRVGHTGGDLQVDLAAKASIEALFERVGTCDAVISAAGDARFGPLAELTDDAFEVGLRNKLMGQVNLVRVGAARIAEGGSITLTTGVLAQHPIPGSAAIALVNGGLESFVRAAALEMPRGVRVNVVSPGWVKETMEAMGMDSSPGLPAAKVAFAYRAALGAASGQVLRTADFA